MPKNAGHLFAISSSIRIFPPLYSGAMCACLYLYLHYKKKLNKKHKKLLQANARSESLPTTCIPEGIRSAKCISATKDMYIGGVDPSHSTSDVTKHIQNMGITIRTPVQVLVRKEDWCSFRVGVPADDVPTISSVHNWQPDIKVRPFRPRRQPGDAKRQVPARSYDQREHHNANRSTRRASYTSQRRNTYNRRHVTQPHRPENNRKVWYKDADTHPGDQWKHSARPAHCERNNSYDTYSGSNNYY